MMKKRTFPYHRSALFTKMKSALLPKSKAHSSLNYTVGSVPLCNLATGPIYALLFQMAVYNKQTLPLNDKITGKNQMENKWQAIVSMIGMFVPVIEVLILQAIFDETTAYWILLLIGLGFTLTETYWMRNIYQRMMRRRYSNLEGFHATR